MRIGKEILWSAASFFFLLLLLGTAQTGLALHQREPGLAFVPNAADGIAISPHGRYLYAGDGAAAQLVVINTENLQVLSRISVEHAVHGIDFSPDCMYIWAGGGLPDYPWLSAVSVVNTAGRRVKAVVSPGVGDASHFAITPDGREVWVASVTTNLLWIIDAQNRSLSDVVPLSAAVILATGSPEGEKVLIGLNEVAIFSDGGFAYAVGPEASVVYAVEVSTRRLAATARMAARPMSVGRVTSPSFPRRSVRF